MTREAPFDRSQRKVPRGARTRERILEAALQVFSRNGYEGATLADLAEELDFTKASLYYYFTSKEALLIEIVTPYIDDVDALVEGLSNHRARSRKEEVLASYLDLLLHHQPVVRFLATDVSALNHPGVGDRIDDQLAAIRRALSGSRPSNAADIKSSAALGTLWRPVVSLTGHDLSKHRELLVKAALAVLRVSPN